MRLILFYKDRKMPLKLIFAFILGCALGSAATAQSSSKYLKILQQEGYTLYFIKPVAFKKGKNRLALDFTFQHGPTVPETVVLRFSLYSKNPIREMDGLSFFAKETPLGESSGPELMFLEQDKGWWHARFASTISYPTLIDMLEAGENLEIRFHRQETAFAFPANRKWGKASSVVKEILKAEVGEK